MSMILTVPHHDVPEFSALPLDVKMEIKAWLRELAVVARASNKRQAFARAAHVLHASWQTVRRKYHAMRTSGDWRCLINRAKVRGEGERVPDPIVEEYARRAEGNQRKSRPAHRDLMREWRRGELSHLPWPELDDRGLPRGCSYDNLMRRLRARGGRSFELTAMRDGLGAALGEFGPKVLTTRVGLWVGSHYIPDDVKRDIKVLMLRGQEACIQELGVMDLFSGDRFAVHRRPQFERADGTKDSLKEREMRFLFAHIFRNIGYSPRGTEIPAEKGTAAVRRALAKFFHDHSGGKITVREPGIIGRVQAIAGYFGRGGGNPRHKARLEAHHNLLHNEAAHLPAPTGHDRNPPEWLHGLQAITGDVIKELGRDPKRAQLMIAPMLEYWQACSLLREIDDLIAWRTDHELEGWIECGHTLVEWRRDVLGNEWLSPEQFLALDAGQQQMLVTAASLMPALRRARKLAPREVFGAGMKELVTLPDAVIALMFCDRELGDDLRRPKSLNADGDIEIQDGEIAPDTMTFEGTLAAPDGGSYRLAERTKYGVVVSPFEAGEKTVLWVYGPRGEFLGTAARRMRSNPHDTAGIERQLGRRAHEIKTLLTPLQERHAGAAAEIEAIAEHNSQVRKGGPSAEELRAAKREEVRIAAVDGSLSDFLDDEPAKPADAPAGPSGSLRDFLDDEPALPADAEAQP
jgi:hypothetical protein